MNLPPAVLEVIAQDAIRRDRTTARRVALLEILLQERYLTREQLIVRVEGKLGKGCFGEAAWVDTFYRDMQVVKQALSAAGYQVAFSRSLLHPGYYLRNQPAIGEDLSAILAGSLNEIDRAQILILARLDFKQRFQQGFSITNLSRQVVASRLQQRFPGMSLAEANRLALQKGGQE
jgi:hypothetical protein